MFKAYKISDYDHVAEEEQFADVCQLLKARFSTQGADECLLVGNVNIEGVELDALLFAPGLVRILEFKNWGGDIVATENGSWTSGNMIISGGAGRKSPFEQARINRSKVARGMRERTPMCRPNVSVTILFRRDARFDIAALSGSTREWLFLCDNAHIEDILKRGSRTADIDNALIARLPRLLGLQPTALVGAKVPNKPVRQAYELDAGDCFGDIEKAINLVPDYGRVYSRFNELFNVLLQQHTASKAIDFGGPNAMADYLLKENGADIPLTRAVNDLRVRLRAWGNGAVDTGELEQHCYNDTKALCQFVALIYKRDVPPQLSAFYASKVSAMAPHHRPRGNCMRVTVRRWDENFLYGLPAEGDGVEEVKVCYTKGYYESDPIDGTYLRDLLYEGATLNIVPPFERDGVVYGRILVFEPDCLVSVESVARCFKDYADSPLEHLLSKLGPAPSSDALLLGNFVGQLFDEALRDSAQGQSYRQSVRDFYKDHALELLNIQDSEAFHKNAQEQREHIEQVIRTTLPALHSGFDKRAGMVEPSFFSEMLGLQGRMDFLQLDFKLLMELKSGKGEWPYDNFRKPAMRREHSMQLVLYCLILRYNYYAQYKANKEQLASYLLYSKYQEPLLDVHPVPQLVQEAMRMRNRIAALERQCAKQGGADFLVGLTADDLNEKQQTGNLWKNHQRLQIEAVLQPIREASPLEKSYFLRFLSFVSKEHLLAKVGNNSKECAGFASAWHQSLEAKRAAGTIYANLQLVPPQPAPQGGISTLTLLCPGDEEDNGLSNFRKGDIVVLYPYDPSQSPDLRATMVFRSTIEAINTDSLTLRLRAPQSDQRAFQRQQGRRWAIEHDFMEASFTSLYKGLHAFLKAPQERRDLLLLQRPPQTDTTRTLQGDYGAEFNPLALRVKQARDLFLIVGPPGTGKTSYGLMNNVKEELLTPGTAVLILAYTNRAVDEICGKLEAQGIDYIRVGNETTCEDDYKPRLLSKIASKTSGLAELRDKMDAVRVTIGTTASISARLTQLSTRRYSLCIVDEASQLLEPHLLSILAATDGEGKSRVEKTVLIGDPKQLPAVVQQDKQTSAVSETLLAHIGLHNCRDSLFERLLRRYGNDPAVAYTLSRQGRMHNDIARFPSQTFYSGILTPATLRQTTPLPHTAGKETAPLETLLLTQRLLFIDVEAPTQQGGNRKVNPVEADIIAHITLLTYERMTRSGAGHFAPGEDVGIIVPYRNQIAAIRQAIAAQARQHPALRASDKERLAALTIDTVERFQGSQRKCIIFGFTVQAKYQLQFLTDSTVIAPDGTRVDRKLNVALTRAKEQMVMVGHAPLLAQVPLYHQLLDFIRQHNGYLKIAAKEAQTLARQTKMP